MKLPHRPKIVTWSVSVGNQPHLVLYILHLSDYNIQNMVAKHQPIRASTASAAKCCMSLGALAW